MIVLSCNNMTKSFGVETILEDISFSINENDKVGIVGINGTGKTTLFKVITGIYGYDSGDIFTSKSCKIGYLEQNTNFYSENSIYDEAMEIFSDVIALEEEIRALEKKIAELSKTSPDSKELQDIMKTYGEKFEYFEEVHGYGYKSEVIGVLRGLGFSDEDLQKPVNVLSGGEKTRVLLAKLLLSKPTLLMLDEPTNHLDAESVEWLEGFLRAYEGTVMIISHDRYFLDQSVNRIFEIANKRLTAYKGNYTDYIRQSKIQKEIDIKRYENQQKELKKQYESVERLKAYGREKHLKRARSKEKMLEKIERLDKPQEFRKRAKINFQAATQSGMDVLQVENLEKHFPDRKLFSDVNFEIYRGEKVALIGPNGVGKSSLFKILVGMDENYSGDFNIGKNVEIGYFHQEQKTLDLNNTIIDEIWNSNEKLTQTQVRSLLGAFLFEDEEVFKEIKSLSGGERARVAILKLILSKSNFLLLDEPTNHLDIDSKEVLEEALLDYDGTILTISHDRYFLNTVIDKIMVLREDGVEIYLGNYDYYMEKKRANKEKEEISQNNQVEEKTKTQLKEEKRREKEQRQKEAQEKKKIKDLEDEIEQIEKKIRGLEMVLCQEEVYSDPEKTREVNQEKSQLEKRLEGLMAKWEELL